ncbi:MAG: GLPGLI family protein [Chryseobacterium sp.]|nr:GLPGLI family protein [Chryseobacterium sp.]
MKILNTFLFLIFGLLLKAQYLQVNYSVIRESSVSTSKNFSPEMKKKLLEDEKKPAEFRLFVAHGNSYFTALPREIVSNQTDTSKGKSVYSHIETVIVDPVKIYRLNGDEKNYAYHKVDDYEFYSFDKLDTKAVTYREDMQIIENYLCKLVEVTLQNNQIIKIWYTESVPLSAGPFSYNSFPGLVLKIEAPSFVMYATEVSNKAKEEDVKTINKKLPVFSGEAYRNKMKELNDKKQNNQNKVIKL